MHPAQKREVERKHWSRSIGRIGCHRRYGIDVGNSNKRMSRIQTKRAVEGARKL